MLTRQGMHKTYINKSNQINVMLALQCMHDNLFKMHSVCWALHAKWYPSLRIDEENPSRTRPWEEVIWRSRSKQNRRCTPMSCWHYNACMIICWKGIAFSARCTQSGTHQWESMTKSKLNTTSGGGYVEVKVNTK